jgi:hypothetical protein
MKRRRIVLLLDGTWNDDEFGETDTNIVRLRQIISGTLTEPLGTPQTGRKHNSEGQVVSGKHYRGAEYIVFYKRGVGTGALLDRLWGGAFGEGLDRNIRQAYKFLSFHYQPGDQIFVFGFSRGSYTARSLVGYIAAIGLLRREHCTEDNERRVWDFYRTSPEDRLPGVWEELGQYVHDRDRLRIELIGVFDTVGALGIPGESFNRWNRERYQFHDVELSSIANVNLHALAIDEHRLPFQATVWRRARFKSFATVTEQVWFPGCHADVGGGYIDEAHRQKSALDDLPLDWMCKRLLAHFPDFPVASQFACLRGSHLAKQHDSRVGKYLLYRKAWRSITNTPVEVREWPHGYEILVCRDRHMVPINEMVHISALERLGQEVYIDEVKRPYAPKNLAGVLDLIEATYNERSNNLAADNVVLVVNSEGKPSAAASNAIEPG